MENLRETLTALVVGTIIIGAQMWPLLIFWWAWKYIPRPIRISVITFFALVTCWIIYG